MNDAVIVALARTPFTRGGSGAFNLTHGATLAGAAVRAAVLRAGIEPDEVEEVLLGCARPGGATGADIARQAALHAGLAPQAGGLTLSRGAAGGLDAVALAARRIAAGDAELLVAGGVESPSSALGEADAPLLREAWLAREHPALYRPPLDAAEALARRHGIARERMELHAAASRRRAAGAQEGGRFADELVALAVSAGIVDAVAGLRTRELNVAADEIAGASPAPHALVPDGQAPLDALCGAEHLAAPGDGAAACVLMDARRAERRGLRPWGRCAGFAVAGCAPGESGLAPVFAVRRLLQRLGLSVEDIDLWELHEASAAQVLLCADRLELPPERLNVDGGALALGSPDGASGARMVAHALAEGRRRGVRRVCVAAEAGTDVAVAGMFELA